MSNAKELVAFPLAQPDQTILVSTMPASAVDLNLRPPSWLGWMKLLEATVNWSRSAITFSMSLPRVLRRTIGWKAFRLSYDDLFGFGMTTVVDTLKYLGQCLRLMQASAILMTLEGQVLFLTMIFQWRHVSLSGPGEDESAHLLIADKNSDLEKEPQFWDGFCASSLRILTST